MVIVLDLPELRRKPVVSSGDEVVLERSPDHIGWRHLLIVLKEAKVVVGNGCVLQKVTSLKVGSCRRITDVAIEAIGKGCPNVRNIHLSKCAFVSDNGFVSLTKATPSIENLQLEECHRI